MIVRQVCLQLSGFLFSSLTMLSASMRKALGLCRKAWWPMLHQLWCDAGMD